MTLKEIAAQTGYSIATFSRVLNKTGQYSTASKAYQEITRFAEEMGYKCAAKKGGLVAVVIPDIENPLFGAIVKTVQELGREDGLDVIVVNTNESAEQEAHALQYLAGINLFGMIYTPVSEVESREFMVRDPRQHSGVPVVLVDRDLRFASYDSVFINNVVGAFDATSFLLERGFRDIAVITGRLDTKPGRERLEGYRNAYEFHGLTCPEELVFHGDFTVESGYRATKEILRVSPRPRAIFSTNNLMTRGCLKALMEAAIPIGTQEPDGIALASFDNDIILDVLDLDIPYVQRPMAEMGKIALELLKNRASQPEGHTASVQRIELNPTLVYKK